MHGETMKLVRMSFIVQLLDQHSSTYRIKLELPALKENVDCRAEDEATR